LDEKKFNFHIVYLLQFISFSRHFWQKLIASGFGFDHWLPAPPAAMRQFAAPLRLDIETTI
jgi:hypothetical protein